ncbi:MAG: 23S rRNA (guanosine(2251)-2'-O)-methyltransferase RlmB [Deltaproteobacteria bacterium]|jgi:23S rRNA (guanosine2251-2'-O)-methyltransferase|nr:23S rRNA (guanosine(2251)-2'-O)-methyltransferase RlmB [Deltaproteobacteria bacterium]
MAKNGNRPPKKPLLKNSKLGLKKREQEKISSGLFKPQTTKKKPIPDGVGLAHQRMGQDLNDSEAVVGLNSVLAALQSRGSSLRRLLLSDTHRHKSAVLTEILQTLQSLGQRYQVVPASYFRRFTPTNHQGIAAFFEEISPLGLEDLLATLSPTDPTLLVALDHILDPGNLGALFRSAKAFGAHALITVKDRAAGLTPQALKAASGACETLPWVKVGNLALTLDKLKNLGFWVVGTTPQAQENLLDFKFPERVVLVLGAEGPGISRLIQQKADFLIKIPLASGLDSLNVAQAGSIFFYAYRSQWR